MPNGKMPMLNGNPVLITQEEFEDCCCEPVLVKLWHCYDSASDLCDGSEASIITELGASYVGKVVRVGGICYYVSTVESGTPVAVIIDEVYADCTECCGDLAPCDCPCTSWPPTSWPCGGLVEKYVMSNGTTSYYDGTPCFATARPGIFPLSSNFEVRLVGDVTCTATANSCEWEGPADSVELRGMTWDMNNNPSVYVDWYPIGAARILLSNCAWDTVYGGSKKTGQTPVGEYPGGDEGSLCSGPCIARGRLLVTEAT